MLLSDSDRERMSKILEAMDDAVRLLSGMVKESDGGRARWREARRELADDLEDTRSLVGLDQKQMFDSLMKHFGFEEQERQEEPPPHTDADRPPDAW